jgi:hypothetical protein
MSASSYIRRHIFGLIEGATFTSRDCLAFGSRAAVDQALSRLVKCGGIRRLARGVFAKDSSEKKKYSDFEIANIKAEAFGRKIVMYAGAVAQELQLPQAMATLPQPHSEISFAINARTSKFCVGKRTIHFKQVSLRKMRMSESKAGQAMRALWHIGRQCLSNDVIQQAILKFNRDDRLELRQNIRWMPFWLTASLRLTPRWHAVRPI